MTEQRITLEDIILAEATRCRDNDDPMSIEEIASFALQEHKKMIGRFAKYNTSQARKLGYKKWSALHVIQYLQDKAT